ncbi:MAG: polysaccharide biosynthesis protein [Clostridia bacterium]|nr:polysaccharide biosynthesis protein [Clostridia bacterium]
MDNKSASRFVRGATILSAAGIICKLIGAVYRIPLTNIIGTEAMGIYSKAYLVYALLWIISTSGLPSAIAKTVSEYRAVGDEGNANKVFVLSRRLLLTVGAVFTVLMILLSGAIASSLGIGGAEIAVICIAPSLMLVVVSSYMGYFQGMQQMMPSAVTQVIGSAGKLAAGTALALLWAKKGIIYAASGALLGVTVSELISIAFIHYRYVRHRHHYPIPPPIAQISGRDMAKRLLRLAVPITLCGAAIPLLNTLDAYLITHCLSFKGYSHSQINSMYGVLNGMVSTIVNLPGALAMSFSVAILPFMSHYKVTGDMDGMRTSSTIASKLALLLGLPCAVGLFILARPIIEFLYPISSSVSLEHQLLGVELLRSICPAILGLCFMHAFNGALQGVGKTRLPLISIGVAAVIKLGLGAALMLLTDLGIKSAPIASSAAFITAGVLNLIFAVRHCGLRLNVRTPLLCLLCSLSVAVICIVSSYLFPNMSWAVMLLTVLVSVLCYLLLVWVLKIFTDKEISTVFNKKNEL